MLANIWEDISRLQNGTITLLTAGTTVITATVAASASYSVASASYTLTVTNAQSHEESALLNGDELIVIVDGTAQTTDFDVESGDIVDVTMTLDTIDPTGGYFEWEFYPTPPLPSSDAYGLRITVTNISSTEFVSSIQRHPGLANVNTGTEYDVDYALATDAHYYSTTEFTPTAADLARGYKDFRITMEATMSDSTVVTQSVTYRYDLSN